MRNINYKQRCAIRFCLSLNKNFCKTLACLRKQSFVKRAQFLRWFKAFSEGRELVDSEPRSGRSSTARTDKMLIKSVILCVQIVG